MRALLAIPVLILGVLLVGCSESDESPGPSASGGTGGPASGGTAGANTGGASTGGASTGGVSTGGASAGGTAGGGGAAPTGGAAGSAGGGASPNDCAPLEPPTGTVIEVTPDQADELPGIVRDAEPGTTISLADGTYRMTGAGEASRRIQIVAERVTLRGASGDREAVVIDGEYETEEIVTVSASNVTLADLTIVRAVHHPVHVLGGPTGDTTGTLLTNLHIVDGGEQFVKINTSGADPNTYSDDGTVECSLFELTDAGRPHVVPEPGGCYTGGIDGHQARGWRVRSNTFAGIHCTNGSLAEHAIHFWTASRDTLVERNTIIDCARGIGFGLGDGGGEPPNRAYADDPYPGVGYVGHYDGTIRNNVISISPSFTFFDTGIELEQARGTRVLHNTVIHPASAFASISHRFPNTLVTLENNLVRNIRARDGSSASGDSNLEDAPDGLFIDASAHDLHLAPGQSGAIDRGLPLDDSGYDIDGEPHSTGAPDIGADELTGN
jgi:hypothetical protein